MFNWPKFPSLNLSKRYLPMTRRRLTARLKPLRCLPLADFVAEIRMQTARDGWCHF
jgi:hypothetical protein